MTDSAQFESTSQFRSTISPIQEVGCAALFHVHYARRGANLIFPSYLEDGRPPAGLNPEGQFTSVVPGFQHQVIL